MLVRIIKRLAERLITLNKEKENTYAKVLQNEHEKEGTFAVKWYINKVTDSATKEVHYIPLVRLLQIFQIFIRFCQKMKKIILHQCFIYLH